MVEVTYVLSIVIGAHAWNIHVRLWPAKPLCDCILFAAWLKNGESALEGPKPVCHWKSMGLSFDR